MNVFGYTVMVIRQMAIQTVLLVCMILALLLGITQQTAASDIPEKKRPRIGIVLSGGGARGAAHVGVLKVLEKMHIPIDFIAGTSMGSIVGGLYASGMTPEEIESVITRLDWSAALRDNMPRADRSFRRKSDDRNYLVKNKPGLSDDLKIKLPSGLIQGQRIDLVLEKLVMPVSHIRYFDDFRIPFRAVATDIVTGKPFVMDSGKLSLAMRASMSIPAIFAATKIDGKLLVDGGVSNNLPINVVRKMGADRVIAIDISTPLKTGDQLNSALEITEQLTGILTRRNTEVQIATLTDKDTLIVPDLGDITNSSFERASDAISVGQDAAERMKLLLSEYSVSEKDYADYKAAQKEKLEQRKMSPPIIGFIRINNHSRVDDEVILARLKVKKGTPLDVKQLEKNISNIYGLELFENISYSIVKENNQTGVVIDVKERSWGPNYLQAGLALSGNENGDNYYNLGFSYTRTAINRLNGEWQSAIQVGKAPGFYTEIYQPLSYDSKYFFHPRLLYSRKTVKFYSEDGDEIANYRLKQYGADLSFGRELGTWGELRLGLRRLTGESEVHVGDPAFPDYDFDRGEIYTRFSVDELDNLNFPRKGYSGSFEYVKSDGSIGADSEFDQVLVELKGAVSWGDNTLLGGLKAFSTLDGNAPIQNRFTLGGLLNLSGFNEDQLSGQQIGLLRLAYLRRINDFNLLPTYVGMSLESGNVWEEASDMNFNDLIWAGSIFLGIDSILGPVYIGYGASEKGYNSVYFYLGKPF